MAGGDRSLAIAMVGQKGFPAAWGGVEFHVDALARGLARRGHRVTVFARPGYGGGANVRIPEGVRVRVLPSCPTKHLDALTHTVLCTLAAGRGHDILHYHAIGPGSLLALARVLSPRSTRILTVHALDWKREKWGPCARLLMRRGEAVAVRSAGGVIAVSRHLARYLRERYGIAAAVIPNGAHRARPCPPGPYSTALGIRAGRYFLFVGRLVPEKGAHLLLEAFRSVECDRKLVIAGPAQERSYSRAVARAAARDPRVVLAGLVPRDRLAELYSGACALVVPSTIEGAPLALLEGMAYGVPVVASDLPELAETVAWGGPGAAHVFRAGDAASLAERLRDALRAKRAAGEIRVPSWDDVVRRTEAFYREVAGGRRI